MPFGQANPDASAVLLEQFRDLDLPAPISAWPPAPGWWILAGLLIVLGTIALITLLRRRRAGRYRREARSALGDIWLHYEQHQDTTRYLSDAAALLRRTSLHTLGRERVASLTGTEFIAQLNETSTRPLPESTSRALTQDLYRKFSDADIPGVQADVEAFITGLANSGSAPGGQHV